MSKAHAQAAASAHNGYRPPPPHTHTCTHDSHHHTIGTSLPLMCSSCLSLPQLRAQGRGSSWSGPPSAHAGFSCMLQHEAPFTSMLCFFPAMLLPFAGVEGRGAWSSCPLSPRRLQQRPPAAAPECYNPSFKLLSRRRKQPPSSCYSRRQLQPQRCRYSRRPLQPRRCYSRPVCSRGWG